MREVIADLPISLGVMEGHRSCVEWHDNTLHLRMASCVVDMGWQTAETMYGHELGHVIGASDDELRLPNLGLPTEDNAPKLSKEVIRRTECAAMGTQLILAPDSAKSRRVALILFGLTNEMLDSWLAEWNRTRIRAALKVQIAKLQG